MEAHIDGCPACGALVAEVARLYAQSAAGSTTSSSARCSGALAAPPPGAAARLGRYRIVGRLGAGGMGTVFSAYDPELDRTVALKVLLQDPQAGLAELRERLSREARAMARLTHPNVVSVFDVGVDEPSGQLFVAMELVVGTTLAGWLRAERPSERAILDAFIAAGSGLLAAHRAGIVHRDFKPDNVLRGADGRIKVSDFGLSRPHAAPDHASSASDARVPLAAGQAALTRQGAILGTPAYMAPEQFRGEPADAKTDQFSFAVALYEALYGRRPFPGNDFAELRRSVLAGYTPANEPGPRWRKAFFARALSASREARYPDMSAVLAELSRDRGRARRVVAITAVALAALGATSAGAYAWSRRSSPPQARPSANEEGAATPASKRSLSAQAATMPAPPAAIATEVRSLRADLEKTDKELADWKPRWDDTKRSVEKAVARARELAYEPLLAEALVRLGRVESKLERPKKAQAALEEAVTVARGARYDELLYDATISLVELVGEEQGLDKEAETWIGFAQAEAKRHPDDTSQLARLDLAIAKVRLRSGKAALAKTHIDKAISARERDGSPPRDVAAALRVRVYVSLAVADAPTALADARRESGLIEHDVIGNLGVDGAYHDLALGDALVANGKHSDAIATLKAAEQKASPTEAAIPVLLAIWDAEARAYRGLGDQALASEASDKALASFLAEAEDGKLSFHDPTGTARSSGAIDFATRIKSKVEKPDDPTALRDACAKAAATAVEGNEPEAIRLFDVALASAEANPGLLAGALGAIHYDRALLMARKGDLATASAEIKASLEALFREVGEDHIRYGTAALLESKILARLGSPEANARADKARAIIARRRG